MINPTNNGSSGSAQGKTTTVVFQGVPGSFSSMAARSYLGDAAHSIHATQFREIFERVKDGSADIGIVPIENAVAGSVHENYDLLDAYPCSIVAEIYIPVQLHLMGLGTKADISRIYSHPKALEQCSLFLEKNPNIEAIVWSDTAGAALHVAQSSDSSAAAVASEEAAMLYGLTILERSVQNNPHNATRFVAIATHPSPAPHPTKCSLVLSLAHKPGSLYAVLGEIAHLQLNLTKLESRPVLGAPFSYSFHIDIECAEGQSNALRAAVEKIGNTSESLKILGFYRHSRG